MPSPPPRTRRSRRCSADEAVGELDARDRGRRWWRPRYFLPGVHGRPAGMETATTPPRSSPSRRRWSWSRTVTVAARVRRPRSRRTSLREAGHGSLNTTVNLTGDVLVGSAWSAAWLMQTVGGVHGHRRSCWPDPGHGANRPQTWRSVAGRSSAGPRPDASRRGARFEKLRGSRPPVKVLRRRRCWDVLQPGGQRHAEPHDRQGCFGPRLDTTAKVIAPTVTWAGDAVTRPRGPRGRWRRRASPSPWRRRGSAARVCGANALGNPPMGNPLRLTLLERLCHCPWGGTHDPSVEAEGDQIPRRRAAEEGQPAVSVTVSLRTEAGLTVRLRSERASTAELARDGAHDLTAAVDGRW